MTTSADRKTEIAGKILDIISKEGMVDREKLTRDATLEDLEIESIDMVMILQWLEEEFEVYVPMDQEIMELKNVGDVIDTVTRLIEAKADSAS